MNEGIAKRVVTMPFAHPIPAASAKTITSASQRGNPPFTSLPKTTAASANTAPTERSNSPEIIKKVTPIATIPIDAASDVAPLISCRLKRWLDIVPKITSRATRPRPS